MVQINRGTMPVVRSDTTVTTDHHRMQSMMEVLRRLHVLNSIGAALFFFATRNDLRAADPLMREWRDGNGRAV